MRQLLVVLTALILAPLAFSADWDHVHLTASNPPAAADWYHTQFGGDRIESGPFPSVRFGEAIVKFRPGAEDFGKSEGTGVDHLGFSVVDVAAKLKALEEAGATVTAQPMLIEDAGFTIAFAEDPWGAKIELLDDADTQGFHHVHVVSPNPEAASTWYAAAFGGQVQPFKGQDAIPSIKYGATWVLITKSVNAPEPTNGRAIDHLGWRVPDIAAFQTTLEAIGGKFILGPQQHPEGFQFGFMETPEGVKIEIIEQKPAD